MAIINCGFLKIILQYKDFAGNFEFLISATSQFFIHSKYKINDLKDIENFPVDFRRGSYNLFYILAFQFWRVIVSQ